MENLTHIQVFRTNIRSQEDKQRVKAVLEPYPGIDEWSVDCDDVDCVLRIVSYTLSADEIIRLVNRSGFDCQELE